MKLFHKIITRELIQDEHAVAIALGLLFLAGQLFFNNFNVVFFCQEFQCFVIGKLLVLHDKMHRRTAFTTSETFADVFGGRHIKRRGPVVVKRTQPHKVNTPPAKRDKIRHHINDLSRVLNPFYGLRIYHFGNTKIVKLIVNKG
ncbi:hypothetical protein SDC9_151635 [bioreactor metagenome]|uniref:Uncharacterized protein n=1 Tax=bioreactor metagenome TaxID=1076179 RepID=A0A645ERD1_9ZZZZ